MKVKATVTYEWDTKPEYWSDEPKTTEQYADIIHTSIEEDPEFLVTEKMTVVEVVVE